MRNLRYAFRTLFRSPFVTIVAIVSLALGIGANAAIFSLFYQMLLKPLPVQEPARLVNLNAPGPKPGSQSSNQAGDTEAVFSYLMFRDLEKSQPAQTVFTGLAAHRLFGANLAYKGQTLNGQGVLVSGSYFPTLGLQPALGRLFDANDDRVIGESHVVVLSHAYWQTRFAGNPNVVNETLIVNGQSLTIVGVAPRDFTGTTLGSVPQVYVPITLHETMTPGWKGFERRDSYWAYVFARLKPGVTIEQARAAINQPYHAIVNEVEAQLQKGMSAPTLAKFRAKEITLTPGSQGQSTVAGEARSPMLLLLGVTGFVLLIACANIANLLLARAARRASEMAIRLSLGASRWQLMVQLLTESLLLAVLGGIAGLVVAVWTLQLIASLMPTEAAMTMPMTLSGTAIVFSGALVIGTGLLFGLFPALHSTRPDLMSSLKDRSGQPSGARGASRFRTSLATAQIALSMMLLVSAGLFTRSLFNVSRTELGVKVENLIVFGISPELNGYTPERSQIFFQRLEDELTATPGVSGATAALVGILSGDNWGNDVAVQGFPQGPDIDNNAAYNEVGPGYFHTLGVPLLAGREFARADTLTAGKVAIVNEAFAKKFNLGTGADVVGKWMSMNSRATKMDIQIVGLVKNAKYSAVKREIPPLFFTPYAQDKTLGAMNIYVRTSLDPEQFIPTLHKVVSRLDPNLPLESPRTMAQQITDNVSLDRMISVLSAAFACLATLLAAVGLYGVLAYTVAQRTREIGLRMALGAAPERVRGMVLRQVAWMTLIGGIIGLGTAAWLGRVAESMLYQMTGSDPLVLVGSASALSLVALIAGFIPAHRASKIDPMLALRYE
jgi:predicted permease